MNESNRLTLAQWRERNAPIDDVLPSGLAIKRKPVNIEAIAISGVLPAHLLVEAQEASQNGQDQVTIETKEVVSRIDDYMNFVNAVVKASLVDPAVADTPDDNHITIDELDLADRIYLLEKALQGVADLQPFRQG